MANESLKLSEFTGVLDILNSKLVLQSPILLKNLIGLCFTRSNSLEVLMLELRHQCHLEEKSLA